MVAVAVPALGVLALTVLSAAALSPATTAEAEPLPAVLTASSSSATASSAADQSGANRRRSSAPRLIAPVDKCPDENNVARLNRAKKAMTCMANFARRSAGLRGFKRNRSLDQSASHKASDILRCDVFSHNACGRPLTFWIEKKYAKRQCWWAGENIARGTKRVGGVRDIFKAWMRSPGHRNAILNRHYTDIGIGFRVGEFRGRQSTRVWVQHFGQIC
jgi:uncharacterized protein YkwD